MRKAFSISILLITALLIALASPRAPAKPEQHVYYGYVPPSSDLPGLDELVEGVKINFTVPAGYALLDVTAYEDGTEVKIYDIVSGALINSTTLNALGKATFFVPYGLYFKVVSNKRVGVLLTGGTYAYDPGYFSGVATFYPTVGGGFRGKHYVFMPAPATHQYGYTADLVHHNLYVFALEDTSIQLKDRVGKFETGESIGRRGVYRAVLQSRVNHGGVSAAVGYDSVFTMTSEGEVIASSAALGEVLYVPAITGGYVGTLFWVPNHATYQQTGRSAVLVVVPLEPCKVTVYRRDDLSVLAEHTFTDTDVAENKYWFVSFGIGRFDLIIASTGSITVMAAQTYGGDITPDFIGDGITFLGTRPGQEVRFFTPSTAIVFSPEDQRATIDGETKELKADRFIILGSGVHSVKGTGHLIIQVLAPGIGWQKWGGYLIEPLDVDASYPEVPELLEKGMPITTYAAIAVVVVAVVAAVIVLGRRRRR